MSNEGDSRDDASGMTAGWSGADRRKGDRRRTVVDPHRDPMPTPETREARSGRGGSGESADLQSRRDDQSDRASGTSS